MKELKIKRAIYCLMATAAIKIATVIYMIFTLQGYSTFSESNVLLNGLQSFSFMFAVAQAVLAYSVGVDLKKGKLWAWITALCFFLFAAPTFALPACIIGFISLIDEDVRTPFINQLDIKI